MNTNVSPLDDRVGSSVQSVSDSEKKETDSLLVLDAHKNASVVFSRALAEENVSITVAGWSKLSPGMLSRHTTGTFLHSSPYQHPERFISELYAHLRTNEYLAVIPISDLSHVLLSKYKRRFEGTGTTVGVENWDTFVSANNKKELATLIDTLSVPGPHTRAPESIDDVDEMEDDFSYPVLIKPQNTTVQLTDGAFTEARISEENYVDHPDELAASYRSFVETYPYLASNLPIVQETIPGPVIATCGVVKDGEFVGFFQEKRLRMFPVDGGSSSLREGIYHPQMAESARKIAAALEWTGPIYIEFVHSTDGRCYVLEVNGRYWGSVGCAIHGGVNVPLIHYRQLKGVDVSPDMEYQLGRRQRRLFYTDLKWLTAQLQAGNVGSLAPFLRSFFEADHDLLRFEDPLAVAGSIGWAIQELLRKKGPRESLGGEGPNRATKGVNLIERSNE